MLSIVVRNHPKHPEIFVALIMLPTVLPPQSQRDREIWGSNTVHAHKGKGVNLLAPKLFFKF